MKWVDVRPLLSLEVANSAGFDVLLAPWDTQVAQNAGVFARLSVVSEQDYSTPTETPDILTNLFSYNTITNASIQIRFETWNGELGIDLATACKRRFALRSTLQRLQEAGISVLREPGPITPLPYTHDGDWVSATVFEIQISFQDLAVDTSEAFTPTLRVKGTGLVDDVTIDYEVSVALLTESELALFTESGERLDIEH
jgi:hypothetical protein